MLVISSIVAFLFFLINVFIFNWMIFFYNIILVSDIYQHKSAIGIHVSPPYWNSLLLPTLSLVSMLSQGAGFEFFVSISYICISFLPQPTLNICGISGFSQLLIENILKKKKKLGSFWKQNLKFPYTGNYLHCNGSDGKEFACNASRDQSLCWEDPLEMGTATHPAILAWRNLWTVSYTGSQRVRHNWAIFTYS